MKDWIQIYVIYFLTRFKMKKITLVFFTFSGIYSAFAQNPPPAIDTAIASQRIQITSQPGEVGVIVVKDKPAVQVFPNPAKNKVELDIKGFDQGYLEVSLFKNNGKMVKREKRLIMGGEESVVFMFSEQPGLYYLMLKQGAKSIRTKLVIQ